MASLSRLVRGLRFPGSTGTLARATRGGRFTKAQTMEGLESRMLLSASLVVMGNNTAIANGQASGSVSNFTDFSKASTTANVGLGFVTRSYVITNTTGSTINLTGGSSLVNISGANAGDFSVVTAPAASLASGASTSFTVQFLPQGTGARNATVSFTDSSSDVPTFSFAVQGTGLATTNASSGLESGTTKAGVGAATTNGDVLEVTYTGYLLNGSIFDSTSSRSGTPLTFRLDSTANRDFLRNDHTGNPVDSNVIDGWEQGLQGVQAGQSLTLIIPSALGYADHPQAGSGIPVNATLIFDIQVTQIAYSPELGIKGNNVNILAGATVTSTIDGTDFGTVSSATATHAFSLLDYSEAINSAGSLIDGLTITGATVTGANAADFTIAAAGSGQFTVTFTPSGTGARAATVHLYSNDRGYPDYTFAVSGSATATQDLVLSIGSTSFPSAIAAGTATAVSLPVTVQNGGNSALPAGASASVQVFLQDTTSGTMTPLAGPFASLNVANLAGGGSKSFSIPVTLPASVALGSYKLVAVINGDNAIAETTSSNDTATTTQVVNVVVPALVPPFSGTLVSSTLAASPFASQALAGTVTMLVTNATGAVIPKGEQVVVTLVAHNLSSGAETTLYTSPAKSVSAMKVGASAKEVLKVKYPAGLATGSYQLEAKIAAVQAIGSFLTTPGVATTTGSGAAILINPAPANYDLGGALVKSTLKAKGGALSGAVMVNVSSLGNAPLSASQQVQIQIIAHPAGAVDASGDVILKTSPFSIKNWKTGHAANFNVAVKGVTLPAGAYQLEARLITAPALAETNGNNNFLTATAAGQALTLTVA